MVVKCNVYRDKTIHDFFINGAAYMKILQQFKLCFSLECVWTEWNWQQKLCPFLENQVTVTPASLKENL